ncbi:tRNA lysidine(34) synthetase TilS [Saccharopolyspora phatthalungensis]|uniref:tRNA(Ile)-lysidine synthase n=1 Tax=Saccharopolyspora phatthalungensis TaxID=664693 RepID=A0A840QAT6_9PSEU|nr:tRNA lysidine(34) synthetase TilS [Saccharopolyspora phatthalungensis]MBB5153963.1 tRNA(Ile)-lysidine synthase [Saccharopolyspora phatthalungensis]
MPPDPAVSAVRTAVRRLLGSAAAAPFRGEPLVVACSGGADSLALAAAASHAARHGGIAVHGLVVDHGLQAGSADVAVRAAEQLRELGCSARVIKVEVGTGGGVEAAARHARYTALRDERPPGSLVLLGHTLDDQAETVLLGLGRGSGARSISGMRAVDPPWARPFLGIRRATTEAACAALGLEPWQDPHNSDSRFTRVRLRTEVLPLLEDVLQGGVREALARTARQLREDADALDVMAAEVQSRVEVRGALDAVALKEVPGALRRRVLRSWLLERGIPEITDEHLRAADSLVAEWRGQGGPALPGDFVLRRAHGTLLVEAAGRKPPNV